MKKSIKLLLLAALAWPAIAMAQGQPEKVEKTTQPVQVEKISSAQDESTQPEVFVKALDLDCSPRNHAKVNRGPQKAPVIADVTVAEGNETNNSVPIYGYYYDNNGQTYYNRRTKGQMIYPADMLANLLVGDKIQSLTFYAPDGIQFGNTNGTSGQLTIQLGECDANSFTSNTTKSFSGTAVSGTVTPKKGDKTFTVKFDSPFTYNGGNLLVDVTVTTSGTSGDTKFSGISTSTQQSINGYYQSGFFSGAMQYSRQEFLPTVSFGLVPSNHQISTENLDFGTVTCGDAAAKSVTITNNYSNDVDLSLEFTGTFKDKFSTNVTATTIPAGGSVTIPIVFKPGTTAGTMTSNLVITSHLTTYRVYLQGKGVAARDANVTPTTVDFGEVLVGGTYTATVKVTSTGILSITPTFTQPRERESAFEITGTTGELIPGAEREYTVTFKPTDEESYSSSFKIKYDTYTDSEGHINSNEHTVTLRGKGVTTVPLQAAPSPLAFGQVTSSQTKNVTLTNINANAVTANLSISPENGPFSIANTTVTVNGNDGTVTVPVTFNPTNAASYTGTLVIDVDGHVTRVPLTGVFNINGEIATRDSAFFAGIEYSWPINVNESQQKKSTLDQIATDPDQIIAMLRKVYMDKNIPGNYYRGYDQDGNLETNNVANYNVQYTGAGTIVRTGNNSARYDDTYGWNIPGTVSNRQTSNNYYYWNMDPEQYRPNQEGVTLLLLEMVDDFNPNFIEIVAQSGYEQLREYVAKTIKSARVVTEAKRTGSTSDKSSGTLFKIDCDKMNKFYLIAKGQLQWMRSVMFETTSALDFYREPCYIYRSNNYDKYVDPAINRYFFLGHMFEQFSPVIADGTEAKSDVYNLLVTQMSSFGVDHDCPNVPFVSNGHHFMMYGEDSEAADCADVRDMVFFVPDYRMMNHPNRGFNGLTISGTSYKTQDYFKYHPDHQPTMGIYVIKQDPVTGAKVDNKKLYKLKLTWKSNMDDFLPSDQQEYQLYQVVTDDFGDQTYVPVYYRNDKGEYTDKDGNPVGEANKVPVVLTMGATSAHEYENVYIDQQTSGQTVTFAVRGQDADHFLSLQMSNEESFFIPGTDATEILHVTSATYYSRFEPQEVNNCYSNKIEVKSNDNSVRSSYIPNGTTFTINRKWNERVGENTVAHTDAVATATVQEGDIIKISINEDFQSPETMYPRGESEPDGRGAGYHANKVVTAEIDRETVNGVEYANFNFIIWDNFVVDVSENGHAGQYVYEVVFETPGNIDGTNSTHAHSNNFTVNVHKTDTKMSKPLTLDQVLNDTQCDDEYAPADVVEFQEQVRLNSKTNLLRYDAYRWDEGDTRYILDKVGQNDEEEEDVPPTGIAGNQGDYYSVSMNEIGTSYYDSGSNVAVNTANPTNWATFVDKYPTMSSEAGAYTYAPVIELFSKGYASHDDSNSIKRMDYNTYGGPLQNTAVGKLKVSVKEPKEPEIDPDTQEVIEDYSLMSEHKWQDDNGVWYSYYNIYLNFEALGVPEGYKLYKVRAWRKVNKDDLGEQLETRKVRIPVDQDGNPSTDWYMYEDMNFGDPLDMSGDPNKLMGAQYFMERKHILGERSTKIGKPTNPDGTGGGSVFAHDDGEWVYGPDQEAAIRYEKRATFGAKRLTTDALLTDFYTLDASFKVRAYFTKESNPLINKFDELYVIGNEPKQEGQENAKWLPNKALATLVCRDGRSYVGTFTPNDAGDGYGYFSLTNKLSSDPNDWNQIASNRIQPEEAQKDVPASNVQLKYYYNGGNCFKAKAGKTYQLTLTNYEVSTVDGANAGVITVTELPSSSNAPRRAEAEQKSAYDYDYYVAEGETTFSITSNGSNIITGISGVKADLNREVVSVTYVNPLGQQSSRPFSGVNMVITRYSDGSMSTTKVVK